MPHSISRSLPCPMRTLSDSLFDLSINFTFLLFIIFSFQHFLLLFTFLEVSRQQPCALPLRSRVPRITSSPSQSSEASKFAGNADGFAESVHSSTACRQLAQDRGRWRQLAKFWISPLSAWPMWERSGDAPAASWAKERPAYWWDALCRWLRLASIGGGGVEWLRLAGDE